MKWLKEQSTEFYEVGVHALIWEWNIAIERNSDYGIWSTEDQIHFDEWYIFWAGNYSCTKEKKH